MRQLLANAMTELRSIEDQIADFVTIAPPEKRICQYGVREGIPACRTPLAHANKGDLCFRHQQMEHQRKLENTAYRSDAPRFTRLPKPLPLLDCIRPARRAEPIPAPQPIASPEPASAAAPELRPVEPEVKTVKEETMPVSEDPKHSRLCNVKDCDNVVGAHCKSGRCQGHWYLKRGMVMKDGSIPRPHTPLSASMQQARIANAAKGETGKHVHKKALPAPTVLPESPASIVQAPATPIADDSLTISLKAPLAALDRFWEKLTVPEKTRIVERELFGGW